MRDYKLAEDVIEYILLLLEESEDLEEAKKQVKKLLGKFKERKFEELSRLFE